MGIKYSGQRNIAKCRVCKNVIESKSVHDFVTCSCGAISVDGGHDYIKRSGYPADFIEVPYEEWPNA
jgi:hypothetical protein